MKNVALFWKATSSFPSAIINFVHIKLILNRRKIRILYFFCFACVALTFDRLFYFGL
jgi:hypothetical protein